MGATKTGEMMSPELMKDILPLTSEMKNTVELSSNNIKDIISGKNNRIILIIGPCSADYIESLLTYSEFLKELRKKVKDKIEIVMRFYTGKPRTIGGWKGKMHSAPGEKSNLGNGIYECREMALKIIDNGIPIADEMLNAHMTPYVDDIFSYIAVGARSTEDQYHREVASGLDVAVGMKNPTSGNIEIMTNSVRAAQIPSHYKMRKGLYDSTGNEYTHGILRGGYVTGPNYRSKYIKEYIKNSNGIINPTLIIDASHDNCLTNGKKDPLTQIKVIREVLTQIIPELIENGYDVKNLIKGFMVESYIFDGNQKYIDEKNIIKGKSFTDPCIGLENTEKLVMDLYKNLD
ncbi:3-deoxy-7-phosphoheptulonate synthase [Candidatus Gracilibacteria bacterium]|nr:3-deoxy-7-phosphoheptulonate synthase [Candidatus Gracilibacteria bacterium]